MILPIRTIVIYGLFLKVMRIELYNQSNGLETDVFENSYYFAFNLYSNH